MPYSVNISKLKRGRNQRRALLKSLAANLVLRKKIITTETKAKSLRPFIERLVTVAKHNSVSSRRYVARYLSSQGVKSLHGIAEDYQKRNGGYTRVVKIASHRRDAARMAFIEFV